MRLPILFALALVPSLHADPPKAVPPGATVELVASDPDVRTPTAIAVDARGRVWVLENNTHFRPKTYDAPPADRLLILDDFGPDGRARKITTYAEGFKDGMGLLLLPGGDAIVSTRAGTVRLRDADGDGRADERRNLLTLTTTANYPHNGLSGIARGLDGRLVLGLGENFGAPWTLTGSDGAVVRGSDEGAVFSFDDEGRGLVRWALGLWNPYGLAFDPAGRLFGLDNDPGGGSLCRLLHIVRHGDYGYRYRYGRTIDHPFTSWDGRWPGTLPPMCYSGEAPTGLLWHGGALLGCTWTDHGVQRFPLEPRGASFTAKPEWLVRGGQDFRPSGIAAASDGTLYVSDWVDGAYEVHGKGRVWRVRGVKATPDAPLPRTAPEEQLAALLEGKATDPLALLKSDDPFLFRAAVLALAREGKQIAFKNADPKVRLGLLLALRERKDPASLADALGDTDAAVRRAALQWIAEERLTDFIAKLDTAIAGPPSRQVFDAYLTAAETLATAKVKGDGKTSQTAHQRRAADIALDPQRDATVRAFALRLLPVNHPALPLEALRTLIDSADAKLAGEAAHLLAARDNPSAQAELRKLAADTARPVAIRAEALAGLAHSATAPETREILQAALPAGDPALRREAARSLGEPLAAIAALPPPSPSAAAGRRIFFRAGATSCAGCHKMEGRGRAIGPDLTGVWRMNSEQLLEALREPSKEIGPTFVQWHVKLRDGRETTGIDQFVDSKSDFTLVDAAGKAAQYRFADVIVRETLPVSLMPPGLADQLTASELADLVAYLRERRE